MILSEYASEEHLVDEFVLYTQRNRISINGLPPMYLFVWGHELWIPEGGKSGYTGSIDLVATDEKGRVWLIEAKQSGNPELCKDIWYSQILNYRKALSNYSPEYISLKTRNFLLNRGSKKLVPGFIAENCDSMLKAFERWAESIGKNNDFALRIYNSTMNAIHSETMISTVLADVLKEEVWEGRPEDEKPYAYIVVNGTGHDFEARILFDKVEVTAQNNRVYDSSKWTELIKQKYEVIPTPENVEKYLAYDVITFFQESLKQLKQLGWNGKYFSNKKAFVVDLPTKYGVPIRIHLGWVDFDGSLAIKNKLPGELGLKFNIDLRHFKKRGNVELQGIGYEIAKELVGEAHYNGRGKALVLQKRDLTDEEKQLWDWEMYRRVDKENRDYIGREEERSDFEQAWRILREIAVEED